MAHRTFSTVNRKAADAQRARREREERDRQWRENEERIRRQRTYLTALRGPVIDALVESMRARAWNLMNSADFESADALLEFLPVPVVNGLLEEFFPEIYP